MKPTPVFRPVEFYLEKIVQYEDMNMSKLTKNIDINLGGTKYSNAVEGILLEEVKSRYDFHEEGVLFNHPLLDRL